MTARAGRRRRTTRLALAATVLAIGLTATLAVGGGLALYHSTEGSRRGGDVPELVFPATPTVLLAGVDNTGTLASLTVLVARPDGTGGSIIPVPVNADHSGGQAEERTPIAETFAVDGPDALPAAAESLLGITIDAVEVAGAARLGALLAPVGPVDVELADDLTGAGGEVVIPAGDHELTPDELADVLTTRDPDVAALEQFPAAVAAWSSIGRAVGDGLGAGAASPGTVGAVLTDVLAGPATAWSLRTTAVDAADNPRDLDVSQLDRIEVLLVFGQVAPGKVGAPNPALSFRVVAPFSEEQLGGHGWSNADVAYQAIATIQFLRGNVVSVDTTPADAGERTRVELSDPAVVVRGAESMFGDVDIVDAEERIVGVDVVVVLGTGFVDQLEATGVEPGGSAVAPSADGGVEPVPTTTPAEATAGSALPATTERPT